MKKLRLSLVMIAVLIGIAGAVANKAAATNHKAATNEYWFAYNEDGTLIVDPTTQPPNQTSDPFACNQEGETNCAASYPAYTMSGDQYVPSGIQMELDTKN